MTPKKVKLPEKYWCVRGHPQCIVHHPKLEVLADGTVISRKPNGTSI